VRKLPLSEAQLKAQAAAEDAAALAAAEAAEAALASASDDDEGDEGDDGGEAALSSPLAGVAAREKARRLVRERKRLVPVCGPLRRSRLTLWRACEDQVKGRVGKQNSLQRLFYSCSKACPPDSFCRIRCRPPLDERMYLQCYLCV
jgi:hypothetical protein